MDAFPLFFPIGFVLLIVVIIVLAHRQRKVLNATWARIAAERSLEFLPAPMGEMPAMHGRYRNVWVRLHGETRGSGKSKSTWTILTVGLNARLPDGTKIQTENALSRLGRMVGIRDVEIGDPAFDGRVKMETDDPEWIRSFFADARIRESVANFLESTPGAVILEDAIVVTRGGLLQDPTPMVQLMDAVIPLAHRIAAIAATLAGEGESAGEFRPVGAPPPSLAGPDRRSVAARAVGGPVDPERTGSGAPVVGRPELLAVLHARETIVPSEPERALAEVDPIAGSPLWPEPIRGSVLPDGPTWSGPASLDISSNSDDAGTDAPVLVPAPIPLAIDARPAIDEAPPRPSRAAVPEAPPMPPSQSGAGAWAALVARLEEVRTRESWNRVAAAQPLAGTVIAAEIVPDRVEWTVGMALPTALQNGRTAILRQPSGLEIAVRFPSDDNARLDAARPDSPLAVTMTFDRWDDFFDRPIFDAVRASG